MEKDDFGVELSYESVMLRHMDRISKLSVQIMGEQFDNLQGWRSQESHKVSAFSDAIRTFESYVPDELKDVEYQNSLNSLMTEYKSNNNPSTADFNIYWFTRLKFLINLLARKGRLYAKKHQMKLEKHYTQEVFDQ